MYNKELYDKIISASCTFEELEAFVTDIESIKKDELEDKIKQLKAKGFKQLK